jgi:hypothetical protein
VHCSTTGFVTCAGALRIRITCTGNQRDRGHRNHQTVRHSSSPHSLQLALARADNGSELQMFRSRSEVPVFLSPHANMNSAFI